MAYKKRGYVRDTPVELVRDYKVFAIACEGGKREPEYFNRFQYLSGKIKVDVIENFVNEFYLSFRPTVNSTKSAFQPKVAFDKSLHRSILINGLHS